MLETIRFCLFTVLPLLLLVHKISYNEFCVLLFGEYFLQLYYKGFAVQFGFSRVSGNKSSF